MDAIRAKDLKKVFKGKVRALDGLSFSVQEGEIFGLLGPNGAGKSTLVRVLATLTRPDSGEAEVAGLDVLSRPAEARLRFGYVAQASGVDKELTGRENLTLQGHLYGLKGARVRERVRVLLDMVGLTDASDRVARGYSGGMRRRLDIAMGLVHEPGILFLDEPTTGLDPETRAALWQDLERLRETAGVTVLLTTHYLEEADRLADRVAIVDRGRIVAEGTPESLKREIQGDVVSLELDGLGDTLPRFEIPGVGAITREGRQVYVQVPSGASALPEIIRQVESQGFMARSVTVSRPTLDDVYLFHTGRTLQSAEEESA